MFMHSGLSQYCACRVFIVQLLHGVTQQFSHPRRFPYICFGPFASASQMLHSSNFIQTPIWDGVVMLMNVLLTSGRCRSCSWEGAGSWCIICRQDCARVTLSDTYSAVACSASAFCDCRFICLFHLFFSADIHNAHHAAPIYSACCS